MYSENPEGAGGYSYFGNAHIESIVIVQTFPFFFFLRFSSPPKATLSFCKYFPPFPSLCFFSSTDQILTYFKCCFLFSVLLSYRPMKLEGPICYILFYINEPIYNLPHKTLSRRDFNNLSTKATTIV